MKKNVLIIILSVLVLGLGGYLVYDKVIANDNEVIEENKELSNSYENFSKKLKEEISTKYNENLSNHQYIENDIVEDGYKVSLESNGSLFVEYNNIELKNKYGKYKIADNVLSFYVINAGQEEGNMLYFINEDGTVGKADTEYAIFNGDPITINNDIGYKNIVSIVGGGFGITQAGAQAGPIFIDIDGNIFTNN